MAKIPETNYGDEQRADKMLARWILIQEGEYYRGINHSGPWTTAPRLARL